MINNTVAEAPDTVSNNLDEISKKIQMEQQPAIGQSAAMLPVEDQASRNARANFSPQAIDNSIAINGTSDQRNYAVDPRNRKALV